MKTKDSNGDKNFADFIKKYISDKSYLTHPCGPI